LDHIVSKRSQDITKSVTLSVVEKVKALKREGKDIMSFGAGEPDLETPGNIKDAGIEAIKKGITRYTSGNGTIELREAITAKLKKENSLSYDASQVIVSSGAKHSLHNVLQALIDPGDEVIVPVPYWVSYPELVKLSSGKPVFAKTDDNLQMTADLISKKITKKTKALFLNSPCNPSGAVITSVELKKIGKLAVEEGIIVISDEIYEKIIFDKEHISIASLGKDIKSHTVVINGVSKAYSMTGWRIGYAAGPDEIINAMSKVQSHATSCPNAIGQHASVEALSGPQDMLETMRLEFQRRRDLMVTRLNEIEGIKCSRPDGAFYAFPDISSVCSGSMEFTERLIDQENVAVVPGIAFGMDKHVRLSFATSMEKIKEGLDRIERFVRNQISTR